MRILDVTPMLTVEAIDGAIAFDCEILGFACLARTGAWACVGCHGVKVMLALPNAHLAFERPEMTGSLYFNTDDVNVLWDRLKDRCRIVYPIEDFEYGMREFAVRDNSGYLLQFGQRIG